MSGRLGCTQYLLAAAAGFALGFASWGEGRAPNLAVALPLAVALCRTRAQGFILGAAYTAALLRHTASFIGGWFDGSIGIGLLAVAGYAAASGAVWSMGWSRSNSAWIRATMVCLAWCVALLPPAALAVPRSPLDRDGIPAAWLRMDRCGHEPSRPCRCGRRMRAVGVDGKEAAASVRRSVGGSCCCSSSPGRRGCARSGFPSDH